MTSTGLKYFFVLFLTLTPFPYLFSQSALSLSFSTINAYIQKDKNAGLFHRTVDHNGMFAAEPGAMLSFQLFLYENKISVKTSDGIFYDAFGNCSGYSMIGFGYTFFSRYKNSLTLYASPAMFLRKSISDRQGYISDPAYHEKGKMQYAFSVAGELEYNLILSKYGDMSISFIQIHPFSIGLGFGYKYWFDRTVRHRKCPDCPSY